MRAMVLGRQREAGAAPSCRAAAGAGPGARRACAPAASAGPTCTSSTASSERPNCRWCSDTRWSARWPAGEGRSASPRASASAYRGSAGPAASAGTAASGARTCACAPLHRLLGRRRLCRAGGRRRALRLPLPAGGSNAEIAPLLCAGLIGFARCAWRQSPSTRPLRLRGLGAHRLPGGGAPGRRVFAFTRPGDTATQAFARELGAEWAGARTSAWRSSTRRSSSRRSASS